MGAVSPKSLATMTRSALRARFDAQGHPVSQERMPTDLKQRLRPVVRRQNILLMVNPIPWVITRPDVVV